MKNVILITIDCGRQDSIYGEKVKTPNIDKLREDAVTFTEAFSQTNTTIPSLQSIFSSQYLIDHQIYSNFIYRPFSESSMHRILKKKGWAVAAFCGIDFLSSCLGSDFDVNNHDKVSRALSSHGLLKSNKIRKVIKQFIKYFPGGMSNKIRSYRRVEAERLVQMLIKHLEGQNNNASSFNWLHFFDAHMIYSAPAEFANKYLVNSDQPIESEPLLSRLDKMGFMYPNIVSFVAGKYNKCHLDYLPGLYYGAISYVDFNIGKLIKYLKTRGIYQDSMIIITSDHGENLKDHGMYCDHARLFDETTKIPLIIKFPDNQYAGTTCTSIVEHVDIYPTVLEYFNCYDIREDIRGKSLLRGLSSKNIRRKKYAFSEHSRNLQRTIRSAEWQYIEVQPKKEWQAGKESKHNQRSDLINSHGDLLFKRADNLCSNLILENSEVVQLLKLEMNKLLDAPKDELNLSAGHVSGKIADQLKSLGYMD